MGGKANGEEGGGDRSMKFVASIDFIDKNF